LLGSIMSSISKLECLVVVSISKPTKLGMIQSFDRVIKLSNKNDNITVDVDDKSRIIKKHDLEVVSRRC
jgi:hypothetical protein